MLGLVHLAGTDSATPSVEPRPRSPAPAQAVGPRLKGRQEDADRPQRQEGEANAPAQASIWGENIAFRVVDKVTQQPIEGALVRASVEYPEYVQSHADGLVREATTNASGVARLPRLKRSVEYAIRKVGYRVQWCDSKEPEMPIELTPSAPFRGQVVDADGAVVCGARAYAEDLASGLWKRADLVQRTDEDGHFTIAGVDPPTRVRLFVSHEGHGCVRVEYVGTTDQDFVITLGDGAVAAGRVIDSHGEGVPGAEVFLGGRDAPELLRWEGWELERKAHIITRTTTDEHGRFEFRGVSAPSERVICVRAPDGHEGVSTSFTLPDMSTRREIVIRVRDVGSIAVSIIEADTGGFISVTEASCSLDGPWGKAQDRERARKDRRMDRLRLGGVEPGKHFLHVHAYRRWPPPTHLSPPPVEVEVRPGEETQIEIAIEAGRTVKGRVVDEDGQVRQAAVCFASTWRGVRQYTETQTYGSFELTGVPPAKGRLTLIDMDNMDQRVWDEIELDDDLGELVLPRGPALVGRLPPSIAPEDADLYVETGDSITMYGSIIVDPDGAFRVKGIRAHTTASVYIIPAGRAAFLLREIVLAPGETMDLGVLAFPAGTVLEGWILDAAGEPVVDAVVYGTGLHAPGRATSDGEGRFRLTRLACLPTTLMVQKEERPLGCFPVEVRDGLPPVTLRLPRPGALRARFLRENGEPLPVARVWFASVSETGEDQVGPSVGLRTDGYGRVQVDLPPGTWTPRLLCSSGNEIAGEPPRVLIRSRETTELEVRVR